ncbi:MAG: hypothetical protein LBD80_01705, partial [Tannerella sp.]|nr:hypothetical protein [Tannerella sp.]
NLNQADELFIKNTQKYLEALMLRAKAKVKSEEYQAKIQTLSEKQERYKQVQDEVKAQKAAGTYSRPLFSSEESDLYREINQLKTESEKILEDVVRLTDAEKKIFASFKAETDRLLEGSITKLKEEISELQKEYDNAATDLERSKLFEQIQAQKELLSKMDLFDDDKGKGKDKGKDPFTEQLETAKKSYKEYYEMINAGLGEEANQAFPDLLQGGDSYKTYLENQRKSILAAAEKTQTELSKTQKKKLAKLNAEIAGETKKTVMSEFQKDLEREKNKAGNVLDLIKLIETKLKEVESSDDPLKQQKMEILVKESEDANQKAEDETDRLLQSYTDYLNEKITFELQYGDRRKKLELELEAEINEEKRRMILAQLEGLEKDRKKYEKQTGDEDYDKLIQEFRTFEQKKFDIEEEFNEKRKKLIDKAGSSSATEKERTEATEALKQQEKKMQEELSKLAVDELTKSEDWVKLFGNLDELTGKEIDNLVEKIETQLEDLSVELSPADAKALKDSLKKAKDEVVENNPFKALIRSVEEYSKAEDEQSKRTALREIFKNVSKSLNTVSQGFSGVVNAIKEMGIEMDETTAEMLENINGLIDASAKLAAGIASQNPMAIVEASIDIIKYGIGLLDSGATRRNRQLAEEYEYYNALADTFDMLIEKQEKLFSMKSGHEVTEAYEEGIKMVEAKTVASRKGLEAWFSAGAKMFSHSNWYNYDKGMGRILSRQKLLTMSAEEWNDFLLNHAEHWARLPQEVKNYANSVMEAGEQIESLTTAMQEALTGVSLDELASGIMDLVSQTDIAFSDISESFYNNMKKAVMRLVQNKTLGSAIEEWYQDFVAAIDNDDKITDDEAERLRRQYTEIIEQGRKEYESMMKVIGEEADTANVNSLAGAIKGASQESIDILAGTTNAVRDNQVRSIEVLRNQLLHLASIDMKIGVSNVHLESIDSKLGNTYDFLRAQGL